MPESDNHDAIAGPRWSPDSAPQRLKAFFERLAANPAELDCVFTELFKSRASAQLETLSQYDRTPLCGALVSVKDLFDIKNCLTRAGSMLFEDQPVAGEDALAIARLQQAGALIVAKTNMTELAYSGLGLNPHFGTPDNPRSPGHIPGGSSSGGAVSVATGAVDIAIGTDTGGSVRIPAAFTGLTGFKPSQHTVSRAGCRPLSTSLDSIGPIARSVSECEQAWRCMSACCEVAATAAPSRIVVPTNFGMTELDREIETGFAALLTGLRDLGWDIVEHRVELLEQYKQLPVWHFSCVESRALYAHEYATRADRMDPRVRSRMARADEVSAIDYCTTLVMRERLIETARSELAATFILLPTVAILPPSFSALDDDDDYYRLNLLALRNTSMANVINGCSISLPFTHNTVIQGAMLTTTGGRDLELLALAGELEHAIDRIGMGCS